MSSNILGKLNITSSFTAALTLVLCVNHHSQLQNSSARSSEENKENGGRWKSSYVRKVMRERLSSYDESDADDDAEDTPMEGEDYT